MLATQDVRSTLPKPSNRAKGVGPRYKDGSKADLSQHVKCGAKRTNGLPCQQIAVKKPDGTYSRCRIHGGNNHKNNTKLPPAVVPPTQLAEVMEVRKKGFYDDCYTSEELANQDQIQLGNVEDEIRLLKIKLQRLMRDEREILESGDLNSETNTAKMRVMQIINNTGGEGGPAKTVIRARPDYDRLVLETVKQIEKLEKLRLEMTGVPTKEAEKKAHLYVTFLQQAKEQLIDARDNSLSSDETMVSAEGSSGTAET